MKEYTRKCYGEKDHCRDEIKIIDDIMDKGKGSEFIVNKRMELVYAIHLRSFTGYGIGSKGEG